jgi:DNA repair exonuclease SbcCD ATPase subunit
MELFSKLESLRDALIGAKADATQLRDKLEALRVQRRELIAAPLCRADLEARLLANLQAQAEAGLDSALMRDVRDIQYSAVTWLDDGGDRGIVDGGSVLYPGIGNALDSSLLNRLIALLTSPEELLKRLSPVLNNLDYSKAGKSLAERRKLLAKIDADIATTSRELESLQDALQAVQKAHESPAIPEGPAYGERRLVGGAWATYGAPVPGGTPGWVYDQN